MWLLPYEHFYIKTHLSRDKVIQKLQNVTDTSRKVVWFPAFANRQHKLYLGKVNEESFNIYRWIHHRDSFLPVIDGNFLSQNIGSTIRIRMHLHWVVITFMILWLGYFGLALAKHISYMITYFSQSGSLSTNSIAVLGFLSFFILFAYGMMIIGFKVDAKRERQSIQELTEAYEIVELGVFESDKLR